MSLDAITRRIRQAERAAGRPPGSTRLIAVSKMQPDDRVAAVLRAGHRSFGENRVQEARRKWPRFRETFPDANLHMIGPLQTNKARDAVRLFDAIHSLDRPALARKIADEVQAQGRGPQLFVQVNTGEEPQKAGCLPAMADTFIAECRSLGIPPAGVMGIPPMGQDPAPHFALLAGIARRNGLAGLSMGMSGDFETAIAHGATHLRVGAALFGPRP
ncbi:MAG: YggS family pyridoxal phosphate-dependent enzyme [Rhodobacteraceae bacterium]|nr:YggS family pyridoxal phosphate-dependent enzyme [Paracoccaceae bacterium]